MVGQQVAQLDIERLDGCEHIAQAGVGWVCRERPVSAVTLSWEHPLAVWGQAMLVSGSLAWSLRAGSAVSVIPMRTECHVHLVMRT